MDTEEIIPLDLDAMLSELATLKEDLAKEDKRIPFSQIDNTLEVYRKNKVVLYGMQTGFYRIYDLMVSLGIEVYRICSPLPEHWNKTSNKIPIISPEELGELNKETDIVVQIAVHHGVYDDNPIQREELAQYGIQKVISWNEACHILGTIQKYEIIQAFPEVLLDYETFWETMKTHEKVMFMNHFLRNPNSKQHIILCMTVKTGDNTLKNTMTHHNIPFLFVHHIPEAFHRGYCSSLKQKVKVFTAVREPISKDLSELYEVISTLGFHANQEVFRADKAHHPLYHGGDAQEIFDIQFDNPEKLSQGSSIHRFMARFRDNIMDLSKHPFDKEKGYAIMTEGNIEVFVFQLERMNDLTEEMSNFIGETQFDEWVMGNEAESKWISSSYQLAKKKLAISQAYFDEVYQCPWLNHFYSQKDIETFQNKWRDHIDPTK